MSVAYRLPMPPTTRTDRIETRNQRLREAFYTRYTNVPRPRKYTREYVVAQLADEFYLSEKTVERALLGR